MTLLRTAVTGVGRAAGRPALDDLGAVRMSRYLTPEAALFLRAGVLAARQAAVDVTTAPRSVGVVCATQTAGLTEYLQMYRSGRTGTDTAANPARGPQSSFNGPASHLSLHLGIEGACLTIAGGPAAGLAALAFAQTFLHAGRAETVLAGSVDAAAGVLSLTRASSHGPPLAWLAPVVTAGCADARSPASRSARMVATCESAISAAGLRPRDIDVVVTTDPETAEHFPPVNGRQVLVVGHNDVALSGATDAQAAAIALELLLAAAAAHVLCVSVDTSATVVAAVMSRPTEGG